MIIWLIDGWINWIDWLADLASINQSINQPKQQSIKPTRPVSIDGHQFLINPKHHLYVQYIDWLIDWLTDLVDWLVVIFLDWLIYLTFLILHSIIKDMQRQTDNKPCIYAFKAQQFCQICTIMIMSSTIDWLVDVRSIGWLVGWLADWLVGWLVDWLIGWTAWLDHNLIA